MSANAHHLSIGGTIHNAAHTAQRAQPQSSPDTRRHQRSSTPTPTTTDHRKRLLVVRVTQSHKYTQSIWIAPPPVKCNTLGQRVQDCVEHPPAPPPTRWAMWATHSARSTVFTQLDPHSHARCRVVHVRVRFLAACEE